MEQVLFARGDATSAAYEGARGELRRLQNQNIRTELESDVIDHALMAYDLEFMLRGYMERISRGELPSAEWLEELRGSWKFYNSDTHLCAQESIHARWPAISLYETSVMEFEQAAISYLIKALEM